MMIAMIVGITRLPFFVSSSMTSHLGRKPDSGGRPPSDNRVDGIRGRSQVNLFQERDNSRVVVLEFRLSARNAVVVNTM